MRHASPYRLCGPRKLRTLLGMGEGVFWRRGQARLWLRSAGKVAAALDVPCLTGRPVALPVKTLLGGIGEARAHLYASFHSGRRESRPDGMPMPIARETLQEITGVSRRSQRAYEEQAGIKVQHNFAVGEAADAETIPERAWKQGNGLLQLKDYRGYQGKKGKTYLACHYPTATPAATRSGLKGVRSASTADSQSCL